MKFAWIDLRPVADEMRPAVIDAAVHARADGILSDTATDLAGLPPTVRKVLVASSGPEIPAESSVDIVLASATTGADVAVLRERGLGGYVHVADDPSLQLACTSAIELPFTVVEFRDPTKIPLEIVIAAADSSEGSLVCQVSSLEEARVVIDVLEKGSEGVLMAPARPDEVFRLVELLRTETPDIGLTTLIVDSIEHNGIGERVCIDTCTHLQPDEGMLIGNFSHGYVLCVSETHPLPYMPTRPFRVNAGALSCYVVGPDNRTNYLSELAAGHTVLAVTADGRTRPVTVARVKLESRPLLTIKATSDDGTTVALTVQDDWHVRVLGPGASVLNVTELQPGTKMLGRIATDQRHVGWPVGEFCIEK